LARNPSRPRSRTEQQAHIEHGRLLKEASQGRTPESYATMTKLLDEYVAIAQWDVHAARCDVRRR
jgi:hypothetical protein